MNTFISTLLLSIALLTTNHYRNPKGQDIPVMVTGLQPGNGQIFLNIFKDKDSYNGQKPFRQVIFDKTAVKDGYLTVSVRLEEGTYGIILIDGEKGFGFSNFDRKKIKRPAFDDIKVVVKNENDIFDGVTPVDIRVKYM